MQAKKLRKFEHRNKNKNIRFTENEISKINNFIEEHGVKFSDFARAKILDLKIKTNLRVEYIYQLKKIGTNLNQIAKKVNEENVDEKIQLLSKLAEIEKQLSVLQNYI